MPGVRKRFSRRNDGVLTDTARGSDAAPHRQYGLLLTAFFVSTAGDWLYRLALPLLVLQMTGSALDTALVYTLEHLPYLLFAILGGVVADRVNRRLLLIRTDIAAALLIGLLTVLVTLQAVEVWMVYAAAFILSASRPLYHAAFQGLIPSLITPDRLAHANSRLQATQSGLDMVGPLLGAGIVATLGVGLSLGVDAVSFLLSAAAIALTARVVTKRTHTGKKSFVGDVRVGLSHLRTEPALLWGAVLAAGSTFGLVLIQSNMVFYLVQHQHLPTIAIGIVFAALGVGALVGALVTPRLGRLIRPGLLIIASMITSGAGTALLLVLKGIAGIAVSWVIVGAGTTVFTVTYYTLRHRLVPDELLGRVVAITRTMAWFSLPVAPIVGGAILAAGGNFGTVVTLSATLQTVTGLLALLTPLRTATGEKKLTPDAPVSLQS
jgi:MFS family permease